MNASNGGQSSAPALAEFILLNEEIATLVRARMPLETHLAKIGRELPARAGQLAERIGQRLAAGESLPAAVDAECASLPAVYRATMLAGMASGKPGRAIETLVETASRIDQLRRVTGLALLYPIIVVTVASSLFAFVIIKVVPSFEWLNAVHFGPLAWLSHYPEEVKFGANLVPTALILLVMIWWWRSRKVGGAIQSRLSVMDWLPGLGRVRRWGQAAAFADLMHLMVESNVPLERALRLAAEATEDRKLREAAEQVAARVERGETAWPSNPHQLAAARHEFPLLIRLALYHSTNRDLLAASLRQAAQMYRERAKRAAEWYEEYTPMLLTIGLGGTLTLVFTLIVIWPYATALREIAGAHWQ